MDDSSQTTTFPRTDHDLLIEVSTNVKNLSTTIHGFNVSNIAITKDHEGRLRTIEKRADVLDGSIRALKWIIGIAVLLLGSGLAFVATIHR
jgi:hypothetical protein